MRRALPLLASLLLGACVLDRTGRSAATDLRRQLALHAASIEQIDERVVRLEEVVRVRGKQDAVQLETLDQIRAEVRRLRGDLEVVRHDLQAVQAGDARAREEADFRLTWLERRAEQLEAALGLAAPPPTGGEQAGEPGGEPDAAGVEPASGGKASGDGAAGEAAVAVAEAPPGGVDPGAEEPEGAALTLDEALERARAHLQAGRLAAARALAERALADWPDAPRAIEARFLYAETLYLEGRYQQAVLRYEDVISAAPEGPWAARAMLRQGQCFEAMGRSKEARMFWEDVVVRYPDTEAAEEARSLLAD